jgi:8-oxo-dGTP diphosphatase
MSTTASTTDHDWDIKFFDPCFTCKKLVHFGSMDKMFVANKALLINEEGKILLIRDSGSGDHKALGGLWDVPGGRMEARELPLEGLIREVAEEASIDIRPFPTRPVHVDKWGVNKDIENQPIIGIFWLVSIGNAQVTLSSEHSEYVWADLHNLPKPLMPSLERALIWLEKPHSLSV